MESLLASPFFLYAVFPLGSALLGIAVKHVTRNDQYAKFTKEDLAVGLDLMLTACLMYVLITTDRAVALRDANAALAKVVPGNPTAASAIADLQTTSVRLSSQLTMSGWLIALFFLALWSLSTVVRKWGWKSSTEMKPLVGIALPLAFGVMCLVLVAAGAVQ